MKIAKSFAFVLLMLTLVIGFISSVDVLASDDITYTNISFEAQYVLGDVVVIPNNVLSIDGQSIDMESIVYLPSGLAYQTDSIALEETGLYTIVYQANYQNKHYENKHTFYSYEYLYSFANEESTGFYGEDPSSYETGIKGINVSLAPSDTFTYNDIIDLSELDADTPAIELFVTPQEGIGTKDVKKIIVTFTDIYDSSNYVRVIGQSVDDDGDASQWWANSLYLQAGIDSFTSGIEWARGYVHQNNMWGYPANFSMYGLSSKQPVIGKQFFSLAFDLTEKQVFGPAGSAGNYITDLDNSEYVNQIWDGFTTGEVYVSVTAEDYSADAFNFTITKLGLNDITSTYHIDQNGPDITVDYGQLDAFDLPIAKVGQSYPVFNATAFDAISKDSQVSQKVFYNYYSKQRFELPIINQRFETAREGLYTIEYSAIDFFGNVSTKLVHIQAGDYISEIDLNVNDDNLMDESTVGTKTVVPSATYSGGIGQLKEIVTFKFNGETKVVTDGFFRPEEEGTYEVTIIIIDTVMQEKTYTYSVNVLENNLPVFVEDVTLPKYIIAGSSYDLPELLAYDFNAKKDVSSTITVTDGQGVNQVVSNHMFTFTPDDQGKAMITYTATNTFGSQSITYELDVVQVKDPFIDMAAYFIGNEMEITKHESSIDIKNANIGQDTSFDFINYVGANRFELKFSFNSNYNQFNAFVIELEDYENHNEHINISFARSGGTDTIDVLVNGVSYVFNLSQTFANDELIIFTYDNNEQTISINGSAGKKVQTYSNLETFNGFATDMVYFSGNIEDTNGAAGIDIYSLNGQLLSQDQDDLVKPNIAINGTYQSFYEFGDQATIFSALALDVLDSAVSGSLSVKAPDASYVTSKDGTQLKDIAYDQNFTIDLNQYGSYLVTYTASDSNGSGRASFTYSLLVVDDQKPEITVSGDVSQTAKVNEAYQINDATAYDLVDEDLDVYTFIILPTSNIVYLDDASSYTFETKGVYTLRYLAYDTSGNLIYVDYEITVK